MIRRARKTGPGAGVLLADGAWLDFTPVVRDLVAEFQVGTSAVEIIAEQIE